MDNLSHAADTTRMGWSWTFVAIGGERGEAVVVKDHLDQDDSLTSMLLRRRHCFCLFGDMTQQVFPCHIYKATALVRMNM
nr:hypothetical protein CFP56_01362 [Quercus suber]